MGWLFGALNASAASRISLGLGPPISIIGILKSSPAMLLWSWSNLLLFNLHNQRHASAVAEDSVNKPWRPMPAGRLSSREATLAMYFTYLVVLAISLEFGGLLPCVFEAFFCLWYNEWGGASDPYLKNILNGLGFACFFAGPLEVATGHSVLSGDQQTFQWLLLLAGAITTTAHAQDFRDMEGDSATNRKTVPLLIGDLNARLVLAGGVAGWTVLACWFWGVGLAEWRVGSVSWVAGTIVAGRFFRDRTRAGDRLSWKLFPAWLLGLFVLPMQLTGKH
ncbi:UbiA prenyltransferase [Diaporthe helianthi]|uniref:UbiA prenyltransferase n=1 Tax=Diaporthe helianthi TaxID=158607 RepID=A0A2P5HIX2_DIAHE|nr:UbiA prenyltransferase [Diaporthe helianthi]